MIQRFKSLTDIGEKTNIGITFKDGSLRLHLEPKFEGSRYKFTYDRKARTLTLSRSVEGCLVGKPNYPRAKKRTLNVGFRSKHANGLEYLPAIKSEMREYEAINYNGDIIITDFIPPAAKAGKKKKLATVKRETTVRQDAEAPTQTPSNDFSIIGELQAAIDLINRAADYGIKVGNKDGKYSLVFKSGESCD